MMRHPFLSRLLQCILFCLLCPALSMAEQPATTPGAAPSLTSTSEPSNLPAADAPPETVAAPETATPVAAPPYAAKLRSDADAVFKSEEFHQHDSSTLPVPRPWLAKLLKSDKKKVAPKDSPPDFSGLAQIMKIVVVSLLVLALAWLLWRGWQWLAPQIGAKTPVRKSGKTLEARSLPLQDTALPDSISAAAARAWQNGQHAAALSLLYRGAVQALETHHQLALPAGATEGEYLRLVRRKGKADLSSAFATIVNAWMTQAYADRAPAEINTLLQVYRQHFERAGLAP